MLRGYITTYLRYTSDASLHQCASANNITHKGNIKYINMYNYNIYILTTALLPVSVNAQNWDLKRSMVSITSLKKTYNEQFYSHFKYSNKYNLSTLILDKQGIKAILLT